MADHVSIVNKAPNMSGSLRLYASIKETLIEELFTKVNFKNIYFSGHDVIKNCNLEIFYWFSCCSIKLDLIKQ